MTYLLGVGGFSASGKTTFSKLVDGYLNRGGLQGKLLGTDDGYRDWESEGMDLDARNKLTTDPSLNYDVPEAMRFDWLRERLENVGAGVRVNFRKYDFSIHGYGEERVKIPADLDYMIMEGIYALHAELAEAYDHTIFVDTPGEVCFARRLKRDINPETGRGRTVKSVVEQMEATVIPAQRRHILPTRENAKETIVWYLDPSNPTEAKVRQYLDMAFMRANLIHQAVSGRALERIDPEGQELADLVRMAA